MRSFPQTALDDGLMLIVDDTIDDVTQLLTVACESYAARISERGQDDG